MYKLKFRNEIFTAVSNFFDSLQNGTFISFEDKRKDVLRCEELVPELKEYHLVIDEEFFSAWLIPNFQQMLSRFDPTPAENTRIIRQYISKEKMELYSSLLVKGFEAVKTYFEQNYTGFADKFKEELEKTQSDVKLQVEFKYDLIRRAFQLCLKNGNLTFAEAIRLCLGNNNNSDSDESNATVENLMSSINKLFAWICEHETDILKEFAFYLEKDNFLKEIIKEKYPDPEIQLSENPGSDEVFLKWLEELAKGINYHYTKSYDEHLKGLVDGLIDLFSPDN